jgi:hypothetical protein
MSYTEFATDINKIKTLIPLQTATKDLKTLIE